MQRWRKKKNGTLGWFFIDSLGVWTLPFHPYQFPCYSIQLRLPLRDVLDLRMIVSLTDPPIRALNIS